MSSIAERADVTRNAPVEDDTMLRVEALNFAHRYPPNSADDAVAAAEKYLTFLKG